MVAEGTVEAMTGGSGGRLATWQGLGVAQPVLTAFLVLLIAPLGMALVTTGEVVVTFTGPHDVL